MKDFRFQRHKNPKFSACGGLFRKVILSLLKKIGAGGKFVYKKKVKKHWLRGQSSGDQDEGEILY